MRQKPHQFGIKHKADLDKAWHRSWQIIQVWCQYLNRASDGLPQMFRWDLPFLGQWRSQVLMKHLWQPVRCMSLVLGILFQGTLSTVIVAIQVCLELVPKQYMVELIKLTGGETKDKHHWFASYSKMFPFLSHVQLMCYVEGAKKSQDTHCFGCANITW